VPLGSQVSLDSLSFLFAQLRFASSEILKLVAQLLMRGVSGGFRLLANPECFLPQIIQFALEFSSLLVEAT
jgi:hypothetical protein